MSVKSDFITSLRSTPTGIAGFTETAIPTLEEIAKPTDTDTATIAQGVLAYNLNQIFKTFEGLTLVELLLRIGQHSNVAEAMLLSGLEYIPDTESPDTQKDFTIQEPVNDKTYAQGDMRIVVEAKNGKLSTIIVTVSDPFLASFEVELSADETGTIFYGIARCEEIGEYTFDFSATFNDAAKTTKTASLTITIAVESEETTNPEGEDLGAFNASLEVLNKYYQDVIKNASSGAPVESSLLQKVYVESKIMARLAFSLTAKKGLSMAADIIDAFLASVEVLKS